MSKYLKEFHDNIIKTQSYKKFFNQQTPGGRIFPSKTARNDAASQLRYDAGEVVNGKKKINLQVNSQAKGAALKEFIGNKKGTHGTIASGEIDVNTPEHKQEETIRNLFKTVATQYKSKVG
ncbi:hypothetical protein P153DRAFT_389314 [Dothidotthia symphoricarpi CBS 119687]|uniref:Uncharacterized protein n=1 Tax=Dothidotthia symphoricarpi CBS 119687 TaxID=1392245 RepID=A0A6A6A3Y7_9PLEO|nr:uncharacterized protein P153DRAFT_389314 [Dothidotthia symphoricarpi CBS 119687]KAF2125863.1 hypothetical protein P153DRAFT_389314 [Dothidotthia symphoricarpi CBS 119687]